MSTPAYRLELVEKFCGKGGVVRERHRFIITGNEWFHCEFVPLITRGTPLSECTGTKLYASTGNAFVYPQLNLLWICWNPEATDRFKTMENFERQFKALPRWEGNRYTVLEAPNALWTICPEGQTEPEEDDGPNIWIELLHFDCRTGEELKHGELARLRRRIEPMIRKDERFEK